jgi:hypothetical protein
MPKSMTKEEVYLNCGSKGLLIPKNELDAGKIKTMLKIAEEDLKVIELLGDKEDRWNTLYKLGYDVLHLLTEAFLLFDKVISLNHQCLFSCLCVKHPELELDWKFFEKIRTKRNGIHYYGSSVNKEDWKEIKIQLFLYIKNLKDKIKKKLE